MDLDTARRIRFRLNDTDPENPLISDEELATAMSNYPDWRLAAASLADMLALRERNRPTSFQVSGEFGIAWTDRAKMWSSIAAALRREVADEQRANQSMSSITSRQLTRDSGMPDPDYVRPRDTRYRRGKP